MDIGRLNVGHRLSPHFKQPHGHPDVQTAQTCHMLRAAQADQMTAHDQVALAMADFNTCSARGKFERAERMLCASAYTELPRNFILARNIKFTRRLNEIETAPFLNTKGIDKSAHRVGVAGVVNYVVWGAAPDVFCGAKYGAIRIGAGARGRVPGMALAVFRSGEHVDSRVFAAQGRRHKNYGRPMVQEVLGVSAAESEGPLVFTPQGPLAAVSIRAPDDGRSDLAAIPPGTVLGTLRPANGDPWSVVVTLGGPLRSSKVADRHWRFRHTLHPINTLGRLILGSMRVVKTVLNAFKPPAPSGGVSTPRTR